jgi:hypothetical protein
MAEQTEPWILRQKAEASSASDVTPKQLAWKQETYHITTSLYFCIIARLRASAASF